MAVAVSISASACTPARTAFTLDDQFAASVEGFSRVRAWGDAGLPEMEQAGLGPGKGARRQVAILAISGGGSGGAFAAGVLAGWSATGHRPMFDLVTGVSTGALIAPYAFLGPAYDRELTYLYTSGIAKGLAKPQILGSGVLGSGLLDPEPLRRLVRTYATAALLSAVAEEHRKGRRLVVITTNLDAQRQVIWNLGAIAASGRPDALALFQNVLIASASIPALFPPVPIDVEANGRHFQELHSDGGTLSQIFAFPESLLTARSPRRLPPGSRADIYMIVNNALMPEFEVTPATTLAVGSRALATMVKAQTRLSLLSTYQFAQRVGMDFHLASIDRQIPYDGADPFNTDYMQAVYRLGWNKAVSESLWTETLSSSDLLSPHSSSSLPLPPRKASDEPL